MDEKEIINEIEQIENKLNELAAKYDLIYTINVEDIFVYANKEYFSKIRIDVSKRLK